MVAKMNYDKGMSVLSASQFNYDGVSRAAITDDEVRSVLGFTIQKKPCRTERGEIIPRMNYLERDDGGIVDANCSVGEEFEVTSQPLETYEIARYIMSKVPSVRVETVATMYNGGTSFITLSYGDYWLVPGDTSPHWTNIVLNNPLTRGKLHLVQSCVRVVCMNTLAAACKSGEGYRISHTKNARAMMEEALKGMSLELEAAQNTRRMAEFLASRPIHGEQVARLLDTIYPLPVIENGKSTAGLTRMTNKRNEVLAQFEGDDSFTDRTFWSFFNANSYLIEHPLHKQERTDDAQVAFENITGTRAAAKAAILEAVYEEATRAA